MAQLLEPHPKILPHPLKLRALHRREVAGHFAIFLLFQLQAVGPQGLTGIHQPTHAVGVRGRTGSHLVVEAVLDIAPAREERLAAGAEPLLGRHELRVLLVGEGKAIADPLMKPLLDLADQVPRIPAGGRT